MYKLIKNSKILFGKIIGNNRRCIAYNNEKNGSEKYDDIENYIIIDKEIYFTGIRWECVEYVRRWLIINKSITFDNINNAENMYNNIVFKDLKGVKKEHIKINKDEIEINKLNIGDLLIFSTKLYHITGHVSIIVDIDIINEIIYIAEQNNKTNKWENNGYSYKIDIETIKSIDGLLGILHVVI